MWNGKEFFANRFFADNTLISFDIKKTQFGVGKRKNFYDLVSPKEGYCDIRKVAVPMIKARTADGKKVLLRSDNMTWKFDK